MTRKSIIVLIHFLKRPFKNNLDLFSVVLLVVILSGCAKKHEALSFGSTFIDGDNEFRFLSANRYSPGITNGSYNDVIIVWVEWTCNSKEGCIAGGSNFSLTTNTYDPIMSYVHYPDIFPFLNPGAPIPDGSQPCCGMIKGGDQEVSYLAWNENGCSSYDHYYVKYKWYLTPSPVL